MRPLTRELDKAWDRFGADLPKLSVPTLAVHGVNDPIAPVGAVRAYAEQIEPLQIDEFPGGRHDILNDTVASRGGCRQSSNSSRPERVRLARC